MAGVMALFFCRARVWLGPARWAAPPPRFVLWNSAASRVALRRWCLDSGSV